VSGRRGSTIQAPVIDGVFCKRTTGARTRDPQLGKRLEGSHAIYVSQPEAVAELIEKAASEVESAAD
jgi:hypothetical protein